MEGMNLGMDMRMGYGWAKLDRQPTNQPRQPGACSVCSDIMRVKGWLRWKRGRGDGRQQQYHQQHGERQDQEDCLDESPHVFSYYIPLPLLSPDSLTILLKPPPLLLSVSYGLSSDGHMAVTTHTHTHTHTIILFS